MGDQSFSGERTGRGWDVGERPNIRMAYLDYPEYLPGPPASQRNEQELRSVQDSKEDREAREAVRHVSGWASEKREIYRPLGNPEELPLQGSELRRRKGADYRKPRIVRPREHHTAHEQHASSIATHLQPGKPVRGEIRQFEYAYYQIEMHERIRLLLTLRTIQVHFPAKLTT